MKVYEAQVERCWQGKTEVLGEKPAPFKLCPQQKPTQTGLGFKRGLCGKRPVAKFLIRFG
jgi:hypothetical protein